MSEHTVHQVLAEFCISDHSCCHSSRNPDGQLCAGCEQPIPCIVCAECPAKIYKSQGMNESLQKFCEISQQDSLDKDNPVDSSHVAHSMQKPFKLLPVCRPFWGR